jgi:hypothetical protein
VQRAGPPPNPCHLWRDGANRPLPAPGTRRVR